MPIVQAELTNEEFDAIQALGGNPNVWALQHLKAPAQECVARCKAAKCLDVGLKADLTQFGVTAEEQAALIKTRADQIAADKLAAEKLAAERIAAEKVAADTAVANNNILAGA